MTPEQSEQQDMPMKTPPDRRLSPPRAPRPLKYGWAVAISATVAVTTFAQLQYPGSPLHHCSRFVLELLQMYAPGQEGQTLGAPPPPPATTVLRR
jgi:hypothetical protein